MPTITVKPVKSYSHFKESVKRFKEICDSPIESDEYQEAVMLGNIIRDYEKGCSFGVAIEALKEGELVHRKGWNGSGMFVMKQIPAEINLDVIPNMQSVQKSAKSVLVSRGTTLKYQNQMLIIKPDGTADSWVPSSSDVFAEDWIIM